MIDTYDWLRGSGKTTKVIDILNESAESVICIVPTHSMKMNYPEGLQHRVIVAKDDIGFSLTGRYISTVILDEGFLYKKDRLAKLYYELGRKGLEVISYGTIE